MASQESERREIIGRDGRVLGQVVMERRLFDDSGEPILDVPATRMSLSTELKEHVADALHLIHQLNIDTTPADRRAEIDKCFWDRDTYHRQCSAQTGALVLTMFVELGLIVQGVIESPAPCWLGYLICLAVTAVGFLWAQEEGRSRSRAKEAG